MRSKFESDPIMVNTKKDPHYNPDQNICVTLNGILYSYSIGKYYMANGKLIVVPVFIGTPLYPHKASYIFPYNLFR